MTVIEAVRGRRVGTALQWFGMVGLVLTGLMAVGCLWGWASMGGTEQRLQASRLATVTALGDASRLMGSTSGVIGTTTTTFDDVASALQDTSSLLGGLSDSTRKLAGAMDISILGQRPFAGVGSSFEDLSSEFATVADDAQALASTLGENKPQMAQVAADLRAIQASIGGLVVRVQAFTGLEETIGLARGFALLSGLLAVWLAFLAAGCTWLGSRLRG